MERWGFERSLFVANDYISIFSKIDEIVSDETIIIGGESDESDGYISEEEFQHLINKFPNTYEKKIYAQARVSSLLKERFGQKKDYESNFTKYLNKKLSRDRGSRLLPVIGSYELQKYKVLHEQLQEMLGEVKGYSELQWQNLIIEFILLLYPKYLYAFTEAPVLDYYYKNVRSVDFILVDYDGNADIIEIKKPFENGLITKHGYRDNHIPLRELSGTVMQVEKYVFNLMKSGSRGEKKLNDKYKEKMHDGFSINLMNPKGIIISGRTNNLSAAQKVDLEIVKRKYNNIVDILSYDDLLNRLNNIIGRFEEEA